MNVALISCSKTKLQARAPARNLYQGERFTLALAVVDLHHFDRIFIVSSKHGLVRPDEELAPYDEDLSTKSPEEQDAWAKSIADELTALGVDDASVTVYADDLYGVPLQKHLANASFPLTGMTKEEQVAFLTKSLIL